MRWSAYFILSALLISACSTDPSETKEINTENEQEVYIPAEQLLIRHIESELQIPATEKYDYEIFKEELNGDDSIDYVITVNRLDHAIEEAIKDDKIAKRAEIGYLGMYNFVFYMDGASKKISGSIPVGSSPHTSLKVNFVNICSEHHKDFTVDFRVRNSCFRRFFTIVNEIPHQTFETIIFDGLGTEEAIAYDVRFEPGTYSLANDIVIYNAKLESVTIEDPMAIYKIDPEITPSENLNRRWYYHEGQGKYFTRKDETPN